MDKSNVNVNVSLDVLLCAYKARPISVPVFAVAVAVAPPKNPISWIAMPDASEVAIVIFIKTSPGCVPFALDVLGIAFRKDSAPSLVSLIVGAVFDVPSATYVTAGDTPNFTLSRTRFLPAMVIVTAMDIRTPS